MAFLGPSLWGLQRAFTGNLLPKFPGVQDIGSEKFPLRNIYVSGTVFGSGNEAIQGTLSVTGATILGSTLAVTGITTTSNDIKINVAGKGLQVKSGSNAKAGTVVANGVTGVVVSTTAITANSVVQFGLKTVGGTPADVYMDSVIPGTSFTIKSAALNTSTYNWIISDLI